MKGILIAIIVFMAILIIYNSLGMNFTLNVPNIIANQLTKNLIESNNYQIFTINSYNKYGIGIIFYNDTENCVKYLYVNNISYPFTYSTYYNEIIIYTNNSIMLGSSLDIVFCDGKYINTIYS